MTVAAVESGASFERVLHALEDAGQTIRRRGMWQASAQCPAHEDGEPSLSVTWRDGKTLLHCFNGCTDAGSSGDPVPVLEALGLASDDLFDQPLPPERRQGARSPRPRRTAGSDRGSSSTAAAARTPSKRDLLGPPTGRWRVVAEYVYTDENGEPLGKVVRQQRPHEHSYAKRFWQKHWAGQCTRTPCQDKQHGKTVLHEQGWGNDAPRRRVLYNLPGVLAAVAAGREVWLAEGEKDADALNEHFQRTGSGAVATTYASGAGSWNDDYAAALAGARVVIVEDNDPETRHPVTGELREPPGRKRSRTLLAALEGTAAAMRVVRAKTGKDSFDHLAAGHQADDFEPVEIPSDPEASRASLRVLEGGRGRGDGGGEGSGGGTSGGAADDDEPNQRTRYLVRHGELVKASTDRHGLGRYDVVLGCTATVVRVDQKVITGDEPPVTTGYMLRAEHPAAPEDPREFLVSRKAWDSGDWLHDLPWAGVTFDSSRTGLAKVRDAIRMTSPAATVTLVHGAPGWVRADDGSWMFIHAGGALGAAGPVPVETDLPAKLAHFMLPGPPAEAAALREAAGHSAGLVEALPPRIGAVLAGLAYRAAICRMPPSVTLIGPPASYKTSMGKVALHHFAPDLPWDESVLSLSERGATGNAGARLMHLTRDVLLLADDAAPDRSLKAAAERVASIVRLQYNGETRDRLDRDAEMRRPDPPRGSLLISAEVGPSAASASQRTLMVPFHPGEITRETRIALWEPESRHGRAAALASFITWQAGQREQILERLETLTRQYADEWHEAGHDERTAEALAHLTAGWRLFLDHLTDSGAYTPEEAEQLWQQARDGLGQAGRMQNDPDEPADPAGRIIARLRTALAGKYGHLTTKLGSPPPSAEAPRYGWTVEPAQMRGGPMAGGEVPEPILRTAGADWVGCYADEDGERRLWLMPELTLIMLRRVADRLGEPFEETTSSVGEWLRQAEVGLKTTQEKSTGRLRRTKQQTMPGGKRHWVWDIPEAALYGSAGPPGPETGPGGPEGPTSGQDAPAGGNVSGPDLDETDTPAQQAGSQQESLCLAAPGHGPEPGSPGQAGTPPAAAAPGPDAAMAGEAPAAGEAGTAAAVMSPGHPAGLLGYPQLLDLAERDSVRERGPAQLRRRYCDVVFTGPGQAEPCAGCGAPSTVRVGGVPLHLTCPDPPPGWQSAGSPPAEHAQPTGSAEPGPSTPQAPAGATPRRGRGRAAAEMPERRWRAAAAVVGADGIYLPGGEKETLPGDLPHVGALGDLPLRMDLGWGGGKLPPHTGQLWLTAAFLERAGLPIPQDGDDIETREQLLEEAAGLPFITSALADGWEISDASRSKLGHRMRLWRDGNRAGAQIVFIPYIAGEVHLLDGDPEPSALAARLDLYARQTGVPYGRSAAYSGHDLLRQLDARRKIVLTSAADPVPARPAGTGLVTFQRGPADEEAARRYVHSYDTTAAWLSAAKGTELGVGEAVYRNRPEFDPRLPGLWRVAPPAWETWAIPNPFASRRKRDDGTAWFYTPLLAMAADPALLAAQITPLEAWVWPEHTRYLDLWARELNNGRLALAGPPPGYQPEDPDARAVLAALKDTYSGAVTLFGSPQLDEDADTGRERHKFYRPDWAHMVVATATARLYRKILHAEAASPGTWPLAIDRDNLLYASDDPDPRTACPATLTTGHQLGQVKNKGSALMTDAAAPLAKGRFSFDTLIPPGEWDPQRGGPRAEST